MEKMVAFASQSLEDDSELPLVDIDALYFQAASAKKRRIYGLELECISS